MIRRIAAIAIVAFAATIPTALSAQPTAVLSGGYTFVDWLSVNNATIGGGAVDDNGVVYYLKEKQIGGFQSWLIFFDPNANQSVSGTIDFGTDILQMFTTSAAVNVTSAEYRLTPTVTYAGVGNTGLEANDDASFAGSVLTIDWQATDPGDHIRILTAVPEPSTYAMLAMGLGAMFAFQRRRHRNA